MEYYRIQIDELQNGEKMHIPQVGKLVIKNRPFRQRQEIKWYNILKAHGSTFGLSTEIWTKYVNEEDALKVIEDYKNKEQIEKDNKLKSTTYKMID